MTLSSRPRSLPPWLPALSAALLALALYAVSLRGTFVYDDAFIIGMDDRIHQPSQWYKAWTEQYFPGAVDRLYRPLVSMSFAVQWWLHGDHPFAYHVVNWLLHAAVAAAAAELARRLSNSATVGLLTGLLFAAHPVHVEAVVNVVGRTELMCALGTFGALILYLRRPLTLPRTFAITGCFIFALLSKEQGLLVPLLLFFIAKLRRKPLDPPPDAAERRAVQWLTLLICWLFAGYMFFREKMLPFYWERSFLDWAVNPIVHAKGADRWLVPLSILGHYATLLFVPLKLSLDYGGGVIGSTIREQDPYLWIGVAALLAWVVIAIAALRRISRRSDPAEPTPSSNPFHLSTPALVLFALLGLAVTYGMVSNSVFIIGTIFGERLLYLPSFFFLLLIALPLSRLPRDSMVVLVTFILAVATLRTVTYAILWNDRLQLYEYSMRQQPLSIRVYMLAADERMRRGDVDGGRRALDAGIARFPDYWALWYQAGVLNADHGRPEEALREYREAMKLNPNNAIQFRIDTLTTQRATTRSSQPSRGTP